jgi:short-subunit dehydrogenase
MADWRSYYSGKKVWITGASSGIGRAIAEALGKAGVSTVVSARREDRLTELAQKHDSVRALQMDVADFAALEEKTARAWDMLGGVDILINNAGMSHRFLFAEAEPDVLRQITDVNFSGTMLLTRAAVSRMLAAGKGHIVTVTSLAPRVPTPMRSVYTASKTALHGLFDCVRAEVAPHGISVTLVIPGLVRTEISESAATADGSAYGIMDANQANGMPPAQCAIRILRGVARRRREFSVALSPRLVLGMFLRRYLPRLFFALIARVKVHGR